MDLKKLNKAIMFLWVLWLLRLLVVHCKFSFNVAPIDAFRSNKPELMETASYFQNPFGDNHAHST